MSEEHGELIQQAEELLTRLKDIKQPVFVEFSGTPKSGKSTCIDSVGHFFRRLNYNVLAPTEGASKRTPMYLKDDLVAFNTWSICYAVNHVVESRYHSDRYHLALLDRGLFDALVWFDLLAEQGDIDDGEYGAIQSFLLAQQARFSLDAVFLFYTDPATSLQREMVGKLIATPGRAMNTEFLESLNRAYERVRDRYAETFGRFVQIDTSSTRTTTPGSTAGEVAGSIVAVLEARLT